MPLDEDDIITGIIDTKSAGSLKIAGKTVTVDGLLAKSGRRRILPEAETEDDKWDHQFRAEQLREIARKTLTGRRRDVFERMVIGPLMGDEKPDVRTLADKYKVPTKRIYEDLARAKDQVKKAHQEQKPEPSHQPEKPKPDGSPSFNPSVWTGFLGAAFGLSGHTEIVQDRRWWWRNCWKEVPRK